MIEDEHDEPIKVRLSKNVFQRKNSWNEDVKKLTTIQTGNLAPLITKAKNKISSAKKEK